MSQLYANGLFQLRYIKKAENSTTYVRICKMVSYSGHGRLKHNRVQNHIYPAVHTHTLPTAVAVYGIVEAPVFDGNFMFGISF